MTTRSITQQVPRMHMQHTRTRRGAWSRFGALALATLLVAMALLPVATTGVAAEEDEPIIVEIVPQEDVVFEFEDETVEMEVEDDMVEMEIVDDPELDPDALDEIPDFDLPDEEPEPTPGEVTVFKYDCPTGIDLEFVSQEQLLAECTHVMEDVAFHLVTDADDQVQVTNAGGEAYWADVPASFFSLNEEIPDGYSDPFVFCGWGAIFDGVAVDGIVPFQLAAGGTLDVEIGFPAFSMGCYWFNISLGDDDGEVVVLKYDCLEGTDPSQVELEYFGTQCNDKMNGVGFHLSAGGGYEVSATTGDAGAGAAVWTDVPAGPLTLSEEIPAGYGDPVVVCGSNPMDLVYELVEADGEGEDGGGIEPVVEFEIIDEEPDVDPLFIAPGGVVDWELPAGHRLICFWFNIPLDDDDGSITIYKHTCPAGYDPYAVGADLHLDCPSLTNGVTFSLWHGLNPAGEGVTGDAGNGTVFFGGLGTGDYVLVETIPAGIVDLFVECTSAVPSDDPELGPALAYFQPEVIDGGVNLSLIAGEEIVCHWLNIPGDDPGDEPDGGELVVYKYWCDGLLYTIDTCDLYEGSIEFGLQASSGEGDPIIFNTGGDGVEALYLPATTWTLWEIDREWCRAESDDVDADGNLVVNDGETAEVHIFNCGPDQEEEPPVTDLPNTGSGTTAGPEGDPIILHGAGALMALLQFTAAALIAIRASGLTPDNILTAARAIVRA